MHSHGDPLVDGKGRVARKLRISVTDRCNFACLFCMPNKTETAWLPDGDRLEFDEISRVTKVMASMGVGRIRITGGEPLLRPRVEDLVRRVVSISGVESVDMTTNAWLLKRKARALKEAGLRGVSVSLHSLRRERFAKLSGVDALPRVIEGIEEAVRVGLDPVKVNSVAIRGYNDDELIELVDFVHSRGLTIRFIEFMPLDGLGIWSPDSIITGREIREILKGKYPVASLGREKGSTATLWESDDSARIGLVTPMSEPFCDDCDRVRLTSDGKLLSCLFDTEYYDLKPFLRGGGSDSELESFVRQVMLKKPEGVGYMPWINDGWAKPRNMNAIGG